MIKKWNITLSLIAFINIIGYFIIINYLEGLTQGMAMMGVIILPLYFILISILVATLSIIKRKKWFNKRILFSTIFCLFFCSPIPPMLAVFFPVMAEKFSNEKRIVSEEGAYNGSSSTRLLKYNNGETLKEETLYLNDTSRTVAEIRYWVKTESLKEFTKDSTWIYFNNKKDTIKIEYFNDGILLKTKKF
jgi:hypothetical protein